MTLDTLSDICARIDAKKQELNDIHAQISALQKLGRKVGAELDELVRQKEVVKEK